MFHVSEYASLFAWSDILAMLAQEDRTTVLSSVPNLPPERHIASGEPQRPLLSDWLSTGITHRMRTDVGAELDGADDEEADPLARSSYVRGSHSLS